MENRRTRLMLIASHNFKIVFNDRVLLPVSIHVIMFLKKGMFLKSESVQSINLESVSAVSAVESWFMGKLSIDLGARVIRVEACFKQTASIVANMVSKCIQDIKSKKDSSSNVELHHKDTPLEKLERLSNLHKVGALTDEEFNVEKRKLLAKI